MSSIVTDQARFNSMKLRYQFLKNGEHTIVLPHFKYHHFTVVRIVLCLEEEKYHQQHTLTFVEYQRMSGEVLNGLKKNYHGDMVLSHPIQVKQ